MSTPALTATTTHSPTRRAVLGGILVTGLVAAGPATGLFGPDRAFAANNTLARPLGTRPPTLTRPIVVDLSRFDPAAKFPGWNGSSPDQRSTGMFPQDRDLLILGHSSAVWTGDGFIRGGRNVVWLGGTYDQNLWLRNFMGDACVEGVLVRFTGRAAGSETGDGITMAPDAKTGGRSNISIVNCRVEGVDGNRAGLHGDIFQMPAMYDAPSGYCATPRTVTIERLTGSTGYQGFYLAAQQFGRTVPSCQRLTLQDVNVKKIRTQSMDALGKPSAHGINLLWLADATSDKGGDRPYPKVFRNVFLEPVAGEDLNSMMFPRIGQASVNRFTRTKLQPVIASNGTRAMFPSEMQVDGSVTYGRPPGGDFARQADSFGRGGNDIPGIGYQSPGYR